MFSCKTGKAINRVVVAIVLGGPLACVAQSIELQRAYEKNWSARLVPMLTEVVRFPTFAGNAQAFTD